MRGEVKQIANSHDNQYPTIALYKLQEDLGREVPSDLANNRRRRLHRVSTEEDPSKAD